MSGQQLFTFDDVEGLNDLADQFADAFANISTFTSFNAIYVDSGINIGNNSTDFDNSYSLIVAGESFFGNVLVNGSVNLTGDVTISGGETLINDLKAIDSIFLSTTIFDSDVSINSSLEVSQNLMIHGTTTLDKDVSMGAHLRVLGDVSMESNLDVSETLHVFNTTTLEKQVVINDTLLVTGDVSMESDLDVSDNLIVHGKSFLINDVSMGAHLRVLGDVSMESNLDVSENLHVFNETTLEERVTMNDTLLVAGDVSMESSLDISNNLHVFNETTLDKHVHMGTTLDVSGDVSFHSTLEVETFINTAKIGVNATNPSYSIHIDASDAILLPVGDSDSRPGEPNSDVSAVVGLIRYNTDTTQFEGYSSGDWQGLGGVIDVDQDTKILAENVKDEDHLRFYTAGVERMVIDDSGDVFMKHDLILDGSSNPPKIGVGVDPMISLDISATDAIRLPVGTTDQRPPSKLGQLRYNNETNLYETYTTLSTWSGLPLYKTEQPPPLTGISYNSTKEIATIEWNHLVPIYKDVFDGKEYPIYLQTIVDISFTGINDLSSNGWKTIFIGDGNYNTSGNATIPLTKIQFNSNQDKPYNNSTNHDISFDISLYELDTPFPKFGQADSFDIRVYAANRGNGIFNYLEISGVKLLQTQEPSGVEIIDFHDFQRDSFKMDFSFNVDISDTGATMSDVAITKYDISFVLCDTMSLVDQEHSGNQIETWDDINSLDISHILFNASNFAYPGAKYNIQVRATNSKKVDSSGIGIYGEYGDISTSTGFTQITPTQYIDTGDLTEVVPDAMTFSLINKNDINCCVHGKNTPPSSLTILNDVGGEIGITGTSEFFVNYGLQGKNMTDNSGIELVQFEVTKLTNGSSSDISSLACLSADPDGPNDASFTICGFTFESDASYDDEGNSEIYNKGFVYSSNVTCSPGSISGATFLENFQASTNEYELKYEVESLAGNSYEKLSNTSGSSADDTTELFYVDDYSGTPDISFTTGPNLTFMKTTLFGIPSLSTITLEYEFDVSGFANYIIPHSSDNKHSFVDSITNNDVLYTFDPESKKDISMTTTYSFAVTTTKSSEVGGAYVDDTSANLTGSVYYLDHSSGTPTTTTEDFSANIPDKGHLFKDSTTIYDNSYPDIYVFDASNSTIGNEIDTSVTDFSYNYADSLSTMLFYFDGKFVSGGYKNSQNIYPFRDWGNNYAIPGPDYGSYGDTSYNGFKWITLDVTSYRTSSTSNTVDLSGLKINNNKPIMSECGVLYEAYISQDGKFGYLGKQYLSNSPPVWFSEEANTTTIGLSKSLGNGALSTNQQTIQIQAIVNYDSSSPIYLIVGLKNDDANPNYFTFS